jgi:hypothetical protein
LHDPHCQKFPTSCPNAQIGNPVSFVVVVQFVHPKSSQVLQGREVSFEYEKHRGLGASPCSESSNFCPSELKNSYSSTFSGLSTIARDTTVANIMKEQPAVNFLYLYKHDFLYAGLKLTLSSCGIYGFLDGDIILSPGSTCI